MGNRWFVSGLAGLLIIAFFMSAAPVTAAVVTIDNSSTIAGAIAAAAPGDTIILDPGTYFEHDVVIAKTITIRANTTAGGSASDTIIDAANAGRIFDNSAGHDLTIDSLTLQNGRIIGHIGGAIYQEGGALTITRSVFSGCSADSGGHGGGWGGAIGTTGTTLIIDETTFFGCTATGIGGAIVHVDGTLAIFGSTFSGCTAVVGGAVGTYSVERAETLTITDSRFTGCTATGDPSLSLGGAILTGTSGLPVTATISDTTFTGCTADAGGGAIYLEDGTATITSSTFSGCSAYFDGGAINNAGTVIITDTTFSSCTGVFGGVIYNSGTLHLTSAGFTSCEAGYEGGALFNSGTATIVSSAFTGCTAPLESPGSTGSGGAIYNLGTATITSSTFSGCSAASGGGAITNGGTLTMHFSRIVDCGPTAAYGLGSSANAENNWWGSSGAPPVGGGVDASPWLVLGITADPASIDTAGTSAIRTNLTYNSDNLAPGGGYVPDGITNTYAMVSGSGSVSPLTDGTMNGVAQTTFTPVYGETVNISGTVDDQTVYIGLPVAQGAPAVTGITPDSGVNSTGIAITNLAGSAFTIYGTSVVRLIRAGHANITATGVTVVSPSQITCTLPIAGAEAGAWDVVVVSPDGQEGVLPGGFMVTAQGPTLTGITPDNGLNVSAIAITNLAGSGFLSGPEVRLTRAGHANITAMGVTVVSPSQITCILPIAGAEAGVWDVVVVNPDGQEAVLPGGFTVTMPVPTPTPLPTYSQQDTGETLGDFPQSPANPVMTVTVNVGGDSKAWQAVVTGTGLRDLIVTGTEQHGPSGNCNPPAGSVFQYLGLEPARYGTITDAVISFTVPQAWLDENHVDPKSIVLYHMTPDCWQPLPTTFLYEKEGTAYFSGESSKFSSFAIAGTPAAPATPAIALTTPQETPAEVVQTLSPVITEKAPVATQTTTQPAAPAQAPAKSSPFPLVPVIAVICCAVLITGGWYARRWWIRRQNPALFEEY